MEDEPNQWHLHLLEFKVTINKANILEMKKVEKQQQPVS